MIEGVYDEVYKDEKDYTKEEVAKWKDVRNKLKELDITIKNINTCYNENKRLRKENLNLRNAEEMLQSTIRILNNRVDELEKENTKLRNHIDMFSEEEYCD